MIGFSFRFNCRDCVMSADVERRTINDLKEDIDGLGTD
jgi:hypothetical protein